MRILIRRGDIYADTGGQEVCEACATLSHWSLQTFERSLVPQILAPMIDIARNGRWNGRSWMLRINQSSGEGVKWNYDVDVENNFTCL